MFDGHMISARRLLGAVALASVLSAAAQPALAQPAPVSTGWQPGPDALLTNTYAGYVDEPGNGSTVGVNGVLVRGWVADTTAQGWAGIDNVQVWNGQMGAGGTMVAPAAFAQNRPDVGAYFNYGYWSASGFSVLLNNLPQGSQTLNVYAHTPGKGWWFKPFSVNVSASASASVSPAAAPSAPSRSGALPVVTVTSPAPGASVSTQHGDYVINGTAKDPAAAPGQSGVDRVEVWIFGERNSQYGTQLGTVTPDSAGNWSVTFTPTRFPSLHSWLFVYAHSSITGKEMEFQQDFSISDTP